MSENYANCDEIREQHLDTLIKLAFQRADALDAREDIERDDAGPLIDEARKDAVWDMTLAKLTRQEAECKKKNRITHLRRAMPKVIQVAACLVLAMGIAAPFAVAHVEAIRVRVMQLLIDIQEDHTELTFIENEETEFHVPAEWKGSYYPSYIPEGYTLTDISKLDFFATFRNADGDFIYFDECTENSYVNINSENAELSYAKVNGADAFVVEKENRTIITWHTEDRFFVITSDTNTEETMKMARSVRRVTFANN